MDWLRDWEWEGSVERQRKALGWTLMTLFAMAGLVVGVVIETLPRSVHRRIVQTLLPTEAAVRRLIVLVMRAAEAEGVPFVWDLPSLDKRKKGGARGKRKGRGVPAFPLFDRRKNPDPKQKTTPGPGPRIRYLDEPYDPSYDRKVPMPDDPVSAVRLCQRLMVLKAVLDDLPAQAVRLKRVLERAKRKFPMPMRRGRPPGHRERGKELIDEILAECQELAIWALVPPEPP